MVNLKQYIPEKIDIDTLLIFHPPTNIKNFKKDNLVHIINLLTEIPSNKERIDELDGFVPIHSKKLQSRIHNYKQYFEYLISVGIIESDGYYINDEKSTGYRISPDFISEVITFDINDYFLLKKIRAEQEQHRRSTSKHTYLTKWYDNKLAIEYDQALEHLQKEKEQNIIAKINNPFEKYNYTYRNLDRFNDRDYFVSVDKKVGRFHSNLTNMKSEYRNYIRYNNENLVSIDISNSQPYLSTVLFNKDFYNQESPFNIHSITSQTPLSTSTSHTYPPPPMLEESPETPIIPDIQLFRDLVKNGELYEYLEDKFGEELGLSFPDRKAIKEVVFTVLFTANQFIGQEEAKPKKLFKKLFPTVYEVFAHFKKQDKTFLACLLQRIESYLILNVICKRISREYPDLPIYTIHDSIATTSGSENKIEVIMREELTKHIGIAPHLKYDYWVTDAKNTSVS